MIDSQSDWVRLGNDVRGHVYLFNAATDKWELQTKPMLLPEGWWAGAVSEQ